MENATLPAMRTEFFSHEPESSASETDEELSIDFFLFVWVTLSLFLFIFPCCGTAHRRKLCLRRIRERRWISDDGPDDDWYVQAVRRRQEERQAQLIEEQRRFQMSRTDEDDIREKFLAQTLTKFTITLDESDISNRDQVGKAEQSEFSGTEESPECLVDIEAPPPSSSPSTSDDEVQGAVVEGNDDDLTLFQETNEILFVPMPGQEDTEKRRYVPNGCSICLSCLEPGEKITWSSNPDCTHVYHHDCVIHWFLTVGRKAQCKRLRQDPETRVTKEMLCDFPMTCPCCRQPFCVSEKREEAIRHVVTDSTDSDSTDSDSTTSTD